MNVTTSTDDRGTTTKMISSDENEFPGETLKEVVINSVDNNDSQIEIVSNPKDDKNSQTRLQISESSGSISQELNSNETSRVEQGGKEERPKQSSSTPELDIVESENPPKETVFDWIVLLFSFLSNVLSAMTLQFASVLYPYLMEYFQATAAEVGWCFSIESFIASMLPIFNTHLIDRYGCRVPGVIGSFIVCVGIALTSFTPNLKVIYFTYGLIAGYGFSLSSLTSNVIFHQRFNRRRGLVGGLSALGYSIGGIIGSPIATFLVQNFNWRGAYLILSALYANRIAFALLFITPKTYIVQRNKTESKKSFRHLYSSVGKYLKKAFDFSILWKYKVYALFNVVSILQLITMTGYLYHCINRAVNIGIPIGKAFWALSLVGITNTCTRLLVSFLTNLSCANLCIIYVFGLSASVVSISVLLFTQSLEGTLVSSVLFGFVGGASGTVLTALLIDLIGVALLPRGLAVGVFLAGIVRLLTTPFVGWLFDITRSYNLAFSVLGVFGLVASLLMLVIYFIRRRQTSKVRAEAKEGAQNQLQEHQEKPSAQTPREH